jgi:C-terminal processing protease CtpA/Prc
VKSKLGKADLVILDMRGNGGGDDTKGYELSYLLAGSKLKTPYLPRWTSQTPESYQLFVNCFDSWIRQDLAENKPPSQYIVDLKSQYMQMRDNVLAGKPPENQQPDDSTDFDYSKSIKKPIYILIDAHCGSSCESSTDAFEFNKLVKTVGERTAGYVHFGNNGNLFLKNSGINVQMAISYNRYFDGRFIEKVGMEPKIKVPTGSDAMDFAWNDFLLARKPLKSR